MLTAYRFDNEGYFNGTCAVQEDGQGGVLLPPDCIMDAPVIQEGYFARFVNGVWTSEKIPITCADAIEQNFTAISNGPGQHNLEKRAIIEALVANEPENYRINITDDFVMAIKAIPEPTEEELELKQLEEESQELENTLKELQSMYTQAQMIGDTETMKEISNTTKELLGLIEETDNGTEE